MARMRLAAVAAAMVAAAASARADEVTVPMRVDLAFVRRLLVSQVFTEPGEKARVWRDDAGCGWLDLREPAVDAAGGRLRITSHGEARVGLAVAGRCVFSLGWKGLVEVFEEPGLDPAAPAVTFRVVDSNVYDAGHEKRLTTGRVWDLVKAYVHPRLAVLRIDLGRPFEELGAWLPLVVPGSDADVERLRASLAVREPVVVTDGVGVTLAFTVEPRAPGAPPTPPPSEEELRQWQGRWERWDAFLTFAVKHFARDLAGELREAVVDVLLDSRHELLEALVPPYPGAPDPVPALFVKAWERLSPVVRAGASGLPIDTTLQYLSFITAADALAVLAILGPTYGVEISADGLRRLARMVAPGSTEDPVAYGLEVDPELRALMGLGPPLPPPEPSPDAELDLGSWLVSPAWALDHDTVAKLNRMAAGDGDLEAYLRLVRELLVDVREKTLATADLAPEYRTTFQHLVFATAWQESCWRQYIRRGGKLVPLRSPVGSIGMMQVNQHVWRGVYDVKGLQGDIAYNGRAGSEILLRYLKDPVLARREHERPGGLDNVVRATYAVYNGGPGHSGRYRAPQRRRSLRRIDDAFWEKYEAVRAGRELDVIRCYRES